MVLDFPTNPYIGQQYFAPNGVTYTWNGTTWTVASASITGNVTFSNSTISTNNGGNIIIDVNNNLWTFTGNGNIIFPDDSQQATAYTGCGAGSCVTWYNLKDRKGSCGPNSVIIGGCANPVANEMPCSVCGPFNIAIGYNAGYSGQSFGSIGIGWLAGGCTQGMAAVAFGPQSGQTNQGCYSVAIGIQAGNQNQSPTSVAVGACAGYINQGTSSVAIGVVAGAICQGSCSVAVGANAGACSQNYEATAIGSNAGQFHQGCYSVAIGIQAGNQNQSPTSVAVGTAAAACYQGVQSVAIGFLAGLCRQGYCSVAVGANTGLCHQGYQSVAIGKAAGLIYQGNNAVAIGSDAGLCHQVDSSIIINASGQPLNSLESGFYVNPVRNCLINVSNVVFYNSETSELTYGPTNVNVAVTWDSVLDKNGPCGPENIALGANAGNINQGCNAIAIGPNAGANNQSAYGIAIGYYAGENNQCYSIAIGQYAQQNSAGSEYSIAIGCSAGYCSQNYESIAIGLDAGYQSQSTFAIAIGSYAGYNGQSAHSIAIGLGTGEYNQGTQSIAIGGSAGFCSQQYCSIAIGQQAGFENQGSHSVAVGAYAGSFNQGCNSVALGFGAGYNSQAPNSIIINASACALNSSNQGLYINPVRNCTANSLNSVWYNTDTHEITYSNIINASNSAPLNTNLVWYNITDGRIYINYDNQWVDASPQVPVVVSSLTNNLLTLQLNSDGTTVLPGNLVFPDSTVQTTAYNGASNPFNQTLDTYSSVEFANVQVDTSLYFKAVGDNSDTAYMTKNDVNYNVSVLEIYVGDDGTGITIPEPASGDYLAIKSTNAGIHHLFGTNGLYTVGTGITYPDGNTQTIAYRIAQSGFNAQNPVAVLDNIQASIDSSGHPTIQAANTSFNCTYTVQETLWSGSEFVLSATGDNTLFSPGSPSTIGVTFTTSGDTAVGTFTDTSAGRVYRITWVATPTGPGIGYGVIAIERLV